MTECWCGSTEFLPFSPEYVECCVCSTLVSLVGLSAEQLTVKDDETDFYGKKYWLDHQSEDLSAPDIHKRARTDLTERNLHWLKALLKYRLPGAQVMEIGCSHGSFVALMRHAGYDASGVEVSPWVVEFGRQTFHVPIFVGPVEGLDIPLGSQDAIVLMDVLEHLPDPVATMTHCLTLLKPDGMLLIQTPKFRRGMNYVELVETKDPFIELLTADEHLFLFTEESAARLFRQLGAENLQFEPAIFSQYDMFFAVSRAPLRTYTPEEFEAALTQAPSGRMALALLDLREREMASLADQIARGEQIETLTKMVQRADADSSSRGQQIETLTKLVKESEADREARGKQIEALTELVKESEADREARGNQVEALTALVKESEADREDRGKQIETLTALMKESEADREARGKQIVTLTALMKESEADREARGNQIETLTGLLKESEAAQATRNAQIGKLERLREESAGDRIERDKQIENLTNLLKQSEVDRVGRDQQIAELTDILKQISVDRESQDERIAALLTDVRSLFDHRAFRLMVKVARWQETKTLEDRIKEP